MKFVKTLSLEITSDGTDTEFKSDNNCKCNFVKVQTSSRPPQAHCSYNSVKAEDVSG